MHLSIISDRVCYVGYCLDGLFTQILKEKNHKVHSNETFTKYFFSWPVFTIKSIHSRHIVTYGSTLIKPPFLRSIMFNKTVDVYFIIYYAFLE